MIAPRSFYCTGDHPFDPDDFNPERFAAEVYEGAINRYRRLPGLPVMPPEHGSIEKREWERAKRWASCRARVDPRVVEARIKIICHEEERAAKGRRAELERERWSSLTPNRRGIELEREWDRMPIVQREASGYSSLDDFARRRGGVVRSNVPHADATYESDLCDALREKAPKSLKPILRVLSIKERAPNALVLEAVDADILIAARAALDDIRHAASGIARRAVDVELRVATKTVWEPCDDDACPEGGAA